MRNSFDLAFNQQGELFTYDSDMEWDLGAPWYRPTRICHLVSGGEFGWRGDVAKWPAYYEDSCGAVLNIGPGSPTGVVFGYGAKFPAKYQRAFFACDWTFAAIYAVHLEPHGASYRSRFEEFVGGRGLPVTDLAIGSDGAMYFVVGGRRLGSAVYRVRYQGEENVAPVQPVSDAMVAARETRRALESHHGLEDPLAVSRALEHLGDSDRAIRFAARVALESQPVDSWQTEVLAEQVPAKQINGLLALARKVDSDQIDQVARRLVLHDLGSLGDWQRLAWLRCLQLCVARGNDSVRRVVRPALERALVKYPYEEVAVNRELARLFCCLQVDGATEQMLVHMEQDKGKRPTLGKVGFERNAKYSESVRDILIAAPLIDRMHDAQMLVWMKSGWSKNQRRRYFQLMADAVQNSKGGYWYVDFWSRIRSAALEQIPESSRSEFAAIELVAASQETELPTPEGPGRKWTTEELLDAVSAGLQDRDFANGQKMYSAAKCVTCHRLGTLGKSLGPELTQIGERFKIRDIIEATVLPNKAISDQYAVNVFLTVDGNVVTGRVISRDSQSVSIATNLERPGELTRLASDEIEESHVSKVSTMPKGLLDGLNRDEVLDLIAYLISGGDSQHPVFGR
ncbi:MAG TPA: hypothetical protein DDW52_05705 [Planctomycetaceae bacterium]|nr:hypothetical protein [Planctomycetaceae bacterium]